ncbi:MAG: DUF3604 domain-containing protein [Anaerolineae bacterium]
MPIFRDATLTPQRVLAGDSAEFIIRLTLGPDYTPDISRLIFDFPGTVGMSRPTRMHQESDGYVTARVSNPDVTYELGVWDMEIADFTSRERRSWRGMAARMVVLDLGPGLGEGDTLELRWGATTGGYGPGAKVTTVVPRKDYRCTIHVRYFSDAEQGLPDFGRSFANYTRPVPAEVVALEFRVLPRAPHHLRLIRQTDRALLVPYDLFWNVAEVEDPTLWIVGEKPDRQNGFGVFEYDTPYVSARSRGLPITETAAMNDVFEDYNLYWGDVHTHSAHSVDCVEREKMDMTPGDLMDAARQRAGLDFFAVTDHHQPWDIPRHRLPREAWEATIADLKEHHRPGTFVVLPGIEYRCPRGDTVVLFNWLPAYDEIDQRDWDDVRKLWAALQGRDLLTIPHFHNPGRLDAGEWWSPGGAEGTPEPAVEPVLEIFSCHGSYEREDALEHHIPLIKRSRPDRYGVHFLKEGYRYGFVCNSDGHKGHVGTNGLTAAFARTLTRDAILDAYRRRHVYGTTNARIRLLFTGNGHLMGDVVPNTPEKTLAIDVVGEAPLKKVDLFRDGDLHRRFVPEGKTFKAEVTVEDDALSHWYVRATQLDNHIAWSSPIWYK